MEEVPAIAIENLTFSYNGLRVLEDVNLAIGRREFVCVVGPNGGGKTTLLKLVLGLLRPSRGTVRVFGQPPERSRQRIGYLPQHSHVDPQFPVSVFEVVLMGRLAGRKPFGRYNASDRAIALEALRELDLYDLRDRHFSDLSGGQRQRVLIARALACQPDLLLLDEPTASLDMIIEGALYELLRRLSKRLTIVLVTHDLGFVSRYVSSVICVARKVVVHPTSEITGEVIGEIYGEGLCMVRHDRDLSGQGRL